MDGLLRKRLKLLSRKWAYLRKNAINTVPLALLSVMQSVAVNYHIRQLSNASGAENLPISSKVV